jgi:hypothetical protein
MSEAFPSQQALYQFAEAWYVPEGFHPILYHDQFPFFQKTISGISGVKRIFFHFRRSKIAGMYLGLYIIIFNKEVYNYYTMKNVIRKIQPKEIKSRNSCCKYSLIELLMTGECFTRNM